MKPTVVYSDGMGIPLNPKDDVGIDAFLRSSVFHRLADWLDRRMFEPIRRDADFVARHWTACFCASALRRIERAEGAA